MKASASLNYNTPIFIVQILGIGAMASVDDIVSIVKETIESLNIKDSS